jgi:hypothetical protein
MDVTGRCRFGQIAGFNSGLDVGYTYKTRGISPAAASVIPEHRSFSWVRMIRGGRISFARHSAPGVASNRGSAFASAIECGIARHGWIDGRAPIPRRNQSLCLFIKPEESHVDSFSSELSALDARARRAAKRVGLVAKKSRWRQGTVDNYGGFMIIEPHGNNVLLGQRFDVSAGDAIAFCQSRGDGS